MLQRVLLLFCLVATGLACHSKKKDESNTTPKLATQQPGQSTSPAPGSDPILTIPLGSYRGFRYTTKTGSESEVYLGIPYAQPPVGDLRLEAPKEPLHFEGIKDAKNWGSICPPHFNAPDLVNGSDANANEDCLTLNIIKPKNASNSPVLVWIHGGGYLYGGARSFGYTGFADNYIPQGIIVVSIQYRVGTLGYLYDGSSNLAGNYGSLDQVKAIEYLYNYAPFFGGDKNKITVWGLSAGGCSSAELILSHLSRDMIAGSIEMSGSAFSYWGVGVNVKQNTEEFLQAINCTQQGPAMKTCLKNKTVGEYYKAVGKIGYTTNYLDTVKWGPVVDGHFLKLSPFQLAREAAPKPVIVGVSDKDAGYFGILGKAPYMQNLSIPISEQSKFNRQSFIDYVNKLVKSEYYDNNEDQANKVREMIINYYVGTGQESRTNGYYLNKYIEWCDDMYFFGPAVDGIKIRAEMGWQVYAYNFEQYNRKIYENAGATVEEVMGSVHTNEYAYMYDLFNMGNYSMNGTNDGIVHDQLVAAIGTFAKYQQPHIPGKYWPAVWPPAMPYYQFKDDGALKPDYHKDGYDFMRKVAEQGFDFSFLRPTSDLDRDLTTSTTSRTSSTSTTSTTPTTTPTSTSKTSTATTNTTTTDPLTTTPLGTYRGLQYTTKQGTDSEIYLGIPYAQPPIGDLRLEPPEDPERFEGIMNTKEFGNICVPHTDVEGVTIPKGMKAEEDCLTLNIFKPKSATNLSVLVWIHGGGYIYGNAHAFGYEGYADNYNPLDIIVVTIQYRVGPLGYLSDKTRFLPGNYGSLDQVKAIEYIHKYISDFGGNRDKITVWGLSAGGCSASELVLSHLSRKMIAGAIEMSGSAFSYWGTGTTVRKNTEEFISATNCKDLEGKDLKDCLKGLKKEDFYKAVKANGATTNDLASVKWGPVVDGHFLQSSPFQLAREAPPKSIIVGVSNKDAGYFGVLNKALGTMQNLSLTEEEQATFNKTLFDLKIDELIKLAYYNNNENNTKTVTDMIKQHYANETKEEPGYYLNALVEFCNDVYFFGPAVDGIEARRNAGWDVYAYSFEQYNEQLYEHVPVNGSFKGSVHTNEYSYMFDLDWITSEPLKKTKSDIFVHGELVTAIATFAKYQEPGIPNKTWDTVGDDMTYYKFNENGTTDKYYHQKTREFMAQLRDYGFDLNFLRSAADIDRDEDLKGKAFP